MGDGAYDSEKLHEIARENGIIFYAPVRNMSKKGLRNKMPGGRYRRQCREKPCYYGLRWINETVNSTLKRTQIHFLRNKKCSMKQREFAWHIIYYNIKRIIKLSSEEESQTFFYSILIICPIRTEHN